MNHLLQFGRKQPPRALVLLVALASCGVAANAQVTVKMYRDATTGSARDQRTINTYLAASAEAFGTVNARLDKIGERPLYCQPEGFSLNVDNLKKIVDDWARRMLPGNRASDIDALPVISVLLDGLVDTFPCKPGTTNAVPP